MIQTIEDSRGTSIVLQPNASLSWQQSRIVIGFIVTCSMLIAAYCAMQGAWMVLPFAGLESGLFALCITLVCVHQQRRQVIRLESGLIEIAQGSKGPEQILRWPVHAVRMLRTPDVRRSMPPKLTLKSEQDSIELGGFLNRSDRQALYDLLRDAGIRT